MAGPKRGPESWIIPNKPRLLSGEEKESIQDLIKYLEEKAEKSSQPSLADDQMLSLLDISTRDFTSGQLVISLDTSSSEEEPESFIKEELESSIKEEPESSIKEEPESSIKEEPKSSIKEEPQSSALNISHAQHHSSSLTGIQNKPHDQDLEFSLTDKETKSIQVFIDHIHEKFTQGSKPSLSDPEMKSFWWSVKSRIKDSIRNEETISLDSWESSSQGETESSADTEAESSSNVKRLSSPKYSPIRVPKPPSVSTADEEESSSAQDLKPDPSSCDAEMKYSHIRDLKPSLYATKQKYESPVGDLKPRSSDTKIKYSHIHDVKPDPSLLAKDMKSLSMSDLERFSIDSWELTPINELRNTPQPFPHGLGMRSLIPAQTRRLLHDMAVKILQYNLVDDRQASVIEYDGSPITQKLNECRSSLQLQTLVRTGFDELCLYWKCLSINLHEFEYEFKPTSGASAISESIFTQKSHWNYFCEWRIYLEKVISTLLKYNLIETMPAGTYNRELRRFEWKFIRFRDDRDWLRESFDESFVDRLDEYIRTEYGHCGSTQTEKYVPAVICWPGDKTSIVEPPPPKNFEDATKRTDFFASLFDYTPISSHKLFDGGDAHNISSLLLDFFRLYDDLRPASSCPQIDHRLANILAHNNRKVAIVNLWMIYSGNDPLTWEHGLPPDDFPVGLYPRLGFDPRILELASRVSLASGKTLLENLLRSNKRTLQLEFDGGFVAAAPDGLQEGNTYKLIHDILGYVVELERICDDAAKLYEKLRADTLYASSATIIPPHLLVHSKKFRKVRKYEMLLELAKMRSSKLSDTSKPMYGKHES